MKKILFAFVIFGLNQSADVNATLLGRVNTYYGQKSGEAVSKASKEYDDSLNKLKDQKDAKEQREKEIAGLKAAILVKKQEYEAAQKQFAPDTAAKEITAAKAALDKAVTKLDEDKAALPEIEAKIKLAQNDATAKLIDLEASRKQVVFSSPDNDNSGVQTGTGPVAFTNTLGKEANAVSFNAYKLNMLLWQAECKFVKDAKGKNVLGADFMPLTTKKDLLDNFTDSYDTLTAFFTRQEVPQNTATCPTDSTSHYRFVPVYFFLHKTTTAKISNDSLISDLLDNEHGGLINVKFAPSILSKTTRDTNGNPLPTNAVLFLDFGPKYVEAPSLADPKSTTFVGAGYFGLALNFEFGLYDTQTPSKDIFAGAKPQGGMAIGFGVYRNWVDSGGFDNSSFTATIPLTYSTYVFGYEFQVTNLLSLSGTRSIPAESDTLGILGTYSSISVKYNFK